MNIFILYLILLKSTLTSFSGMGSLPVIRQELVINRHVLSDRQLNTAIAAGRSGPGPIGVYVVNVGYFAGGIAGAIAGWLAMVTPAFLIIPMLRYLGSRATQPGIKRITEAATLAGAGLIMASAVPLARDTLAGPLGVAIAIVSGALLILTRIDTLWVIALAAAAGLVAALGWA